MQALVSAEKTLRSTKCLAVILNFKKGGNHLFITETTQEDRDILRKRKGRREIPDITTVKFWDS